MDLFLGFESAAVENWKAMLPEIKAPSNYKKEEVIAAYIAKRMEELEEEVPKRALLGVTMRVVACNHESFGGFDCNAVDAYRHLSRVVADHPHIRMFGFDIRQAIHQLAVTCLLSDSSRPTWGLYAMSYMSMPDVLQQKVSYVNPATLLAHNAADPVSLLSKKLGVDLVFDDNAAKQAASVLHVVKACGLANELF